MLPNTLNKSHFHRLRDTRYAFCSARFVINGFISRNDSANKKSLVRKDRSRNNLSFAVREFLLSLSLCNRGRRVAGKEKEKSDDLRINFLAVVHVNFRDVDAKLLGFFRSSPRIVALFTTSQYNEEPPTHRSRDEGANFFFFFLAEHFIFIHARMIYT